MANEENRPYCFSQLCPQDIVDIAKKFATTFGYEIGGDLAPIVEKLGGQIKYVAPYEERNRATLHLLGKNGFTIRLSSLLSPLHARFAIAHELGHYILHAEFGAKNNEVFAQEYNGNASKMELQANLFAEALLMPQSKISDSDSLVDIAAKFKVPISVANSWTQYLSSRKHSSKL